MIGHFGSGNILPHCLSPGFRVKMVQQGSAQAAVHMHIVGAMASDVSSPVNIVNRWLGPARN